MLFANDASSWAGLVERIGLPTVILGFLLYFAYRAFKWAATTIVQPLFTSMTELIEEIKKTNSSNGIALSTLTGVELAKSEAVEKVASETAIARKLTEGTNRRLDCLCVQTAEQTAQVHNLVAVICRKEGIPIPPAPPQHPRREEEEK